MGKPNGDEVFSSLEAELSGLNEDIGYQQWLVTEGIDTMAGQVPYGLQMYYAGEKVFNSIMRTDYAEAGKQILMDAYLSELNKPYEVALHIMFGGSGLPRPVANKLIQLTKVNMLGAIACANTSHPGNPKTFVERLGECRVASGQMAQRRDLYVTQVLEAAKSSGFFSVSEHENPNIVAQGRKEGEDKSNKNALITGVKDGKPVVTYGRNTLYELENKAFTDIVTKRRLCYKPSELVDEGWFTPYEIELIDKSGVFSPFKP